VNALRRNHEELLGLLQATLASSAQDDAAGYQAGVDALVEWRSRPLHAVLARLARELSDSVAVLPLAAPAEAALAHELPDARARLDHVLQMTEQAAHRTLDCVEDSRHLLATLAAQTLPPESAELIAGLHRNLSAMALAQEYQDIGGQIIRRVAGIMQRVESALAELRVDVGFAPRDNPDSGLSGPAIPGIDSRAFSQNDADDLLSGLGL